MSKLRWLTVFLVAFCLFTANVDAAACGYEERAKLNSEAANVKANYEIKERELNEDEFFLPDSVIGTDEEESYVAKQEYFQVNIMNLTENMYVEVTNDLDNSKKIYTYADSKDGVISFDWDELIDVVTYKIDVKSSNATGCVDTQLRTISLKLPRYNDYSTYAVCESIPDYYLCQRYVTFGNVESGEFLENTMKEVEKLETLKIEEENKTWFQKAGEFVGNHKVAFIAGGIVLVVAAGVITVVIIKRSRRDEI